MASPEHGQKAEPGTAMDRLREAWGDRVPEITDEDLEETRKLIADAERRAEEFYAA